LVKLKVMLAAARFEEAGDTGFAFWSYLHPRESIFCPGDGVHPADTQDCCSVDFIAVGNT
jgi:hypothetical protein